MIETPRDNRRSTSHWLAGIALLGTSLALVSSVSAQEALSSELVPVDAFVADSSDLSMSLRQVEYGIQVPYGFEQLMRENTPDGRFVRRSAGLWAVFPRSEYAATEGGYIATWPAGTYFHIGPPRRTTAEPASQGEVGDSQRVQPESQGSPVHTELLVLNPVRAEASDGRFAANETERPDPVRPLVQQRQPPRHIELVQVRFIMDEAYRRERMQSLVLQAQAARGPSSSPSK